MLNPRSYPVSMMLKIYKEIARYLNVCTGVSSSEGLEIVRSPREDLQAIRRTIPGSGKERYSVYGLRYINLKLGLTDLQPK